MSLSRYFKNTPSFKAEDLVKHADKISPYWTPDPRRNERPFETQQISSPATPQNTSLKQEVRHPEHKSIENRENDRNEQLSSNAPPTSSSDMVPPQEELVDLSDYIDRSEAEKQATESYRKGLKEGHEKAEQDFGAAVRALLLACQQLDTLRATIISNSSKELIDFSFAIAERLLRISVQEQDHTIVATIEEALRRAVKSDEFTINIHPDDYDTLAAKSSEIIAGLSGLNNIVIKRDSTIERGGARIDSDNCTIDATITSQLEMIREELKEKNL
ncbi:MAG: FliH/SctL family protein [Pseudomonadota bacterium]